MRKIAETLKPTYEIKTDYKINRQNIPILFVKHRLAVEPGEYNEASKKTRELEKNGLKVFNTPDSESSYQAIGRLILVLSKIRGE